MADRPNGRGRLTALAGGVFWLVAHALQHVEWAGNFNWVAPYAHELTHGVAPHSARVPRAVVAAAAAAPLLAVPWQLISWEHAFRPLGVYAVLATGLAIHAALRRRDGHSPAARAVAVALPVLALLLLAKVFLWVRVHHYGFALTLPASLCTLALLIQRLRYAANFDHREYGPKTSTPHAAQDGVVGSPPASGRIARAWAGYRRRRATTPRTACCASPTRTARSSSTSRSSATSTTARSGCCGAGSSGRGEPVRSPRPVRWRSGTPTTSSR